VPAVARVDRAEAANLSTVDRALRGIWSVEFQPDE